MRINTVQLRRADQSVHGRGTITAAVGTHKQEILFALAGRLFIVHRRHYYRNGCEGRSADAHAAARLK